MRISDQSADNTDHKVGHTTESDGLDLRELGSDPLIRIGVMEAPLKARTVTG